MKLDVNICNIFAFLTEINMCTKQATTRMFLTEQSRAEERIFSSLKNTNRYSIGDLNSHIVLLQQYKSVCMYLSIYIHTHVVSRAFPFSGNQRFVRECNFRLRGFLINLFYRTSQKRCLFTDLPHLQIWCLVYILL